MVTRARKNINSIDSLRKKTQNTLTLNNYVISITKTKAIHKILSMIELTNYDRGLLQHDTQL